MKKLLDELAQSPFHWYELKNNLFTKQKQKQTQKQNKKHTHTQIQNNTKTKTR